MLRNLFLALFLFALALPALAVPAAPAAASETAMGFDCHGMPIEEQDDGGEQQDANLRLHGCIGCIAPVAPSFDLLQPTALPFVIQSTQHRELCGTAAGPSIPPPRS
jgi:hypothetical protein